MFKEYSLPIKIGFITAIIIAVALVAWISNYEKGRAQDIQMVIQAKSLAVALEKYYDKYNAYPVSPSTNLDTIRVIGESGINEQEGVLYFRRDFEWVKSGKYLSDGSNYAIDFDLKYSWPIWGLDGFSGGKCRISGNVNMACIKVD